MTSCPITTFPDRMCTQVDEHLYNNPGHKSSTVWLQSEGGGWGGNVSSLSFHGEGGTCPSLLTVLL